MAPSASIFERFLSRPRIGWTKLLISLLMLLLPFGAAALDGEIGAILQRGRWRFLILPPTITIYIWLVSPRLAHTGAQVLASLRPYVGLDDEAFDHLVQQASRVKPSQEWLAFCAGLLIGVAAARSSNPDTSLSWQVAYWYLSNGLMYGLLAWTIFASFISTRLNAALHQAPLRFDLLDPSIFEPVGRQSLMLALVFVGGVTFSMLLTFQPENFTEPSFWLSNLLLVLLILLIFFLSMRPTHRLLMEEKYRLLLPTQSQLRIACQDLVDRLERGQDSGDLPARINALAVYETHLQAARTWPYNTATLRTLFFSVFIPIFTVLGRLAAEVWVR